jgi:hypothetical protein
MSPSTGGAAIHPAAGRRRPMVSACSRRQVARRRDLRQSQRGVAVRVPGGRQYGQVIDVLVSARRDAGAARSFFRRALSVLKVTPR